MKTKTLFGFGIALVCAALLNGCVVAFGNRVPPDGKATLGKQLTDLKQARESGAIPKRNIRPPRNG